MKKILSVILSVVTCCCALNFFACEKKNFTYETYTFYCPDGAPAISVAKFINDGENFGCEERISYKVVSSGNIGGIMQKAEGDFIVIPVNACSKLYKANADDPYKTVAVLTHGNLYIVSKTELQISDLKGKVIGVIGQGLVTDLTLKAVLKKNSLEYAVGDTPQQNKVTFRYFSDASDLIPMLKTGKIEIGLLPEPAVTKLQTFVATEYKYRLDLQELYDSENKSYPQAVLAVKSSVLKKYPNLANAVAEKFFASVEWVKANVETAVSVINGALEKGITPSLSASNITPSVIDNCKIFWQGSNDAVDSVKRYINSIREIESNSAALIGEDFFA